MKNSGKAQISFRAATVRERVVTREGHRMKKMDKPPARSRSRLCMGQPTIWRIAFMNNPG